MPIVQEDDGRLVYKSVEVVFSRVFPEDILRNEIKYRKRIDEARQRILNVIRFASVPLSGRGTCLEVRDIGRRPSDLAKFVDDCDKKRADRLKKQRLQQAKGLLPANVRRMRSPQPIAKRRSALFSGTDIPAGHIRAMNLCRSGLGHEERGRFVDLMRLRLYEAAILEMFADDELVSMNGIWQVRVSVMDAHPSARRQRRRKSGKSSKRVKNDDRSFHGRPNRDRGLVAA